MPQIQFTSYEGIKETINISDVQSCLDTLPENIRGINVSKCNLISISNLSRFTNLKYLLCERNKLRLLPELPESLVNLDCSSNKLTFLPKLTERLKKLNCSNNQLTSLPLLSESLVELYSSFNKLTSLPKLPKSLKKLNCSTNQLTLLPTLPESLVELICHHNQLLSFPKLPEKLYILLLFNNPISDILEDLLENQITIRNATNSNAINILNRFRYVYYCLKFKLKFIQWFLRTMEAKIMEQNHPNKIIKLLESGVDIFDLDQYL
jgi:hypothetical protein